jgi:hypothetical protein
MPDDVIAPLMELTSPDFAETGQLFDGVTGGLQKATAPV